MISFSIFLIFLALVSFRVISDTPNSYCNWTPCTCAFPSSTAINWNTNATGFLQCGLYLGNSYQSAYRGLYTLSSNSYSCCEDTDVAQTIYNQWLITTNNVTQACMSLTAELTCIHEFFPCVNDTYYAPFICSDVYAKHVQVCGSEAAKSFYSLPQLSNWASNSNNVSGNYWGGMCTHSDYKTFSLPSQEEGECHFVPWKCQNGGTFSPECSYCICPSGWTGFDCSICMSDSACQLASGLSTQTCVNNSSPTLDYPIFFSCSVNDNTLQPFIGDVPQTFSVNLANSTATLTVRGVAMGGDPDWILCSFTGCQTYFDTSDNNNICKTNKQTSPCIICAATKCHLNTNSVHATPFLVTALIGGIYQSTAFSCADGGISCTIWFGNLLVLPVTCITGECRNNYISDLVTKPPPALTHASGYYFRISMLTLAGLIPFSMLMTYLLCCIHYKVQPRDGNIKAKRFSNVDYESPLSNPLPKSKFEFKKLVVTVKGKTILNEVSGTCISGRITAIMGPSGAGKTSLVDVLAGRKTTGKTHGNILLNGRVLGKQERREKIGYVYQDDLSLMSTLTVREATTFSAQLRLPSTLSSKEINAHVTQTLDSLGILHIADSIIGGGMRRGISGGERKRVQIGLELVAKPKVLIIDEPTSGLDSASCQQVMKAIREVATSIGCIVLVTIHQPRFDVFNKFDSVLLLAPGGNQIVREAPLKCVKIFEKFMNKTVEFGSNPADFLLDSVSCLSETDQFKAFKDFLLEEDQKAREDARLEEVRRLSAAGSLTPSALEVEVPQSLVKTSYNPRGIFKELFYLALREGRNVLRNPLLVTMHVFASAIFGIIVGLMFKNVTLDNAGVQNRAGLFFFTEAFLGFISLSSLGIWREERLIIIRESLSGYYHRLSFFFIKCIMDAILLRVIPTIIYCSCCYWLIGLQDGGMETMPTHYLTFTSICIGISLSSTALCILISSLLPTESTSNLVAILLMLMQLVFGGFLISKDNNPGNALHILQAMSLYSYANEALMVNEFVGLVFYFNPQGYNVSLYLTGETWLAQFFFLPANLHSDISAVYIFAIILYVLSSVAVNLVINESR